MKEIKLTQNRIAMVDDEDYEYLSQWKWYCSGGYAIRKQNKKQIYMHKCIIECPKGLEIDHINSNTYDNRKENLRVATRAENVRNQSIRKDNTSGYKGVSIAKQSGKWDARIKIEGKTVFLGLFTELEDAIQAYNDAAIKYHGKFAKLNNK